MIQCPHDPTGECTRPPALGGPCKAGTCYLGGLRAASPPAVLTYANQPTDSVDAWLLGEACRRAADDPKCGDPIDRGLILLRELQARGFGIARLARPPE